MKTSDVLNRLEDFKNPTRPKTGLWFNEKQFRLQVEFYDKEPLAWVTVEYLVEVGRLDDNDRKRLILGSLEPMRSMLSDFFYSGWDLNYCIQSGRKAERAY